MYRLKANKIILEAACSKRLPSDLSPNPETGCFAVDIQDGKWKVWYETGQRWIVLGDAADIVFDNNTNDFVSTNVQAAIEEVNLKCDPRNSVLGLLWQHSFHEESTAKNEWLANSERNILSNKSPHCIAWKSKLVGLSFTNSRHDVSCDIKIYITSEGSGSAPLTKIYEWQIRNTRVARKTNFPVDIIVNEGDKMAVFISDQGDNPKDVVFTTYWQILEVNNEEADENFNSDFSLSGGGGTTS